MAKQMLSDKEVSPVHLLSSSGELRRQSRRNLNPLLFADGDSRGLKTWRLTPHLPYLFPSPEIICPVFLGILYIQGVSPKLQQQ